MEISERDWFLKGHGRDRPNCLDEVSDGKVYSTVVTAKTEDNCQKPPKLKKLVLEQMERTAERRGTLANSAITKSLLRNVMKRNKLHKGKAEMKTTVMPDF